MKINIKVVLLDGSVVNRRLRTPAHKKLTPAGLKQVVKMETARASQFFQGLKFRRVPLAGGNFNFIEVTPEMENHVG